MSESVTEIESEEQLTEIIESEDAVLLDFQAEWCGPCEMMEPILEKLNDELDTPIVSIDIDEHTNITNKYHVKAVPTFVLIADGQIEKNLTGIQDEAELRGLLKKY